MARNRYRGDRALSGHCRTYFRHSPMAVRFTVFGDYRALTFVLALQPSPPKLASDLIRRQFFGERQASAARLTFL